MRERREWIDLEQKVGSLKHHGGEHFFDQSRQDTFPEADFYMCVKCNQFPFVITIEKDELGYVANKVNVPAKTAAI